MPVSVITYARFSPRPDPENCNSIEAQTTDHDEFVSKKRDWKIVKRFSDPDISGADANREELWKAVASVKRGYVLLVRDLERIARDIGISIMVEKMVKDAGGKLVSIRDGGELDFSPTAKLLRRQIYAFADFFREVNNLRTSAKMRTHQKNGRRMSRLDRPPFGWMIDTNSAPHEDSGLPTGLMENPEEQLAIARIVELKRSGKSYEEIAAVLAGEGTLNRGKRWHTSTLFRIFKKATAQ